MFLDFLIISLCAGAATLLQILPTWSIFDFDTMALFVLPNVIQMMMFFNAVVDTVPYLGTSMLFFLALIVFEIALFVLKLILGARYPYST